MITTVAFDLDDTLYDEIEYCRSGFICVSEFIADLPKTASAKHIFDALWKQFTTGNHTKTFNTALEELNIAYDDKTINKLIEVYRNHTPKITLPPESMDVLDQLSSKYTLALLTDGFLPAQQLKVQALGIEKYFECIIYTEKLGRNYWKPSPVGFEKLIKTLNKDPKTIVYVADNEAKDFISPNKLGFITIQITRPARIHTEPSTESDAAPQHVIGKIRQLPHLLDNL